MAVAQAEHGDVDTEVARFERQVSEALALVPQDDGQRSAVIDLGVEGR